MILDSHDMKELFLEVMRRAKAKYAFRIENFCIMGNHIHIMLRLEGDTSLSRLMQWIMSVFAMSYNRIHGLVGHVWGERFFSRIVSSKIVPFFHIPALYFSHDSVKIPQDFAFFAVFEVVPEE